MIRITVLSNEADKQQYTTDTHSPHTMLQLPCATDKCPTRNSGGSLHAQNKTSQETKRRQEKPREDERRQEKTREEKTRREDKIIQDKTI